MDRNLLIQYTIVGILVASACVWIIVRLVRMSRSKGGGGCSGCPLGDTCKKANPPHGKRDSHVCPDSCGRTGNGNDDNNDNDDDATSSD